MEQVFERYNLHSEVQSHSSRELQDERLVREVCVFKRKGVQMMQENRQLKQRVACEQGQSSEPITICSLCDSPQDHGSSDTSLKLGLPNYK
ncbi:hypothetical protein L6164_032640 [Bauhinia variegata]|uniref:Uncharacterized protein n=1 Tax=Bauhinia variegata TaxID=167791 RepID=A0ACB9KPA5_BAUVA|nr:hypothetical protein L6164_032640 [Bauhinia variegata]